MNRTSLLAVFPLSLALLAGCGDADQPAENEPPPGALAGSTTTATIGAQGGTIEGKAGSALEGVKLVVPAGARPGDTALTLHTTFDPTPLPALAERVGGTIAIEP